MEYVGAIILAALVFATWKQIPKEDPKIIAARKSYGKVD